MDSIFRGSIDRPSGRILAWIDSLLVDHALLRLVWSNAGTVTSGQLYRSNHPTPQRLTRAAHRLGLRSVINLRGATANGSDALSRERAGELGLVFIDAPISSGHPPIRAGTEALIAALQSAPRPILLHCKSGADRAGFAAAIDLILQGVPVEAALRQLTWRHGHLRYSRAGVLEAFLRTYQRHAESRKSFADWLHDDYDEAELGRRFKSGGLSGFVQDRLLKRE